MVDDDVAQRSDRVVEVAAILDAELLGHRDLHRADVVAVPDRLEHRVREPQVEKLLQAHLPEKVGRSRRQLLLGDVSVQFGRQRARRSEIVAERLLDGDALPGAGQAGAGQPLDHPSKQRRWDLQVKRGVAEAGQRVGDAGVGRWVAEIAADVAQAPREPGEHLLVERLAALRDRLSGTLGQLLDRPAVGRDAHHRHGQEPTALKPVERAEGHLPRQVAGDPEDNKSVSGAFTRHGCNPTRSRVGHAHVVRGVATALPVRHRQR